MTSATICPKEIYSTTPVNLYSLKDFEKNVIVPVNDFIDKCQAEGIVLYLSYDLIGLINQQAPWKIVAIHCFHLI